MTLDGIGVRGRLADDRDHVKYQSYSTLVRAEQSTMTATNRRRGQFIVLVGPDGVGKTSVAAELIGVDPSNAVYFHFRPPVLRALATRPDFDGPVPEKRQEPGMQALGWARLLKNFLHFWIGYATSVLPALRRGLLVIGDRWAYGYLVQPVALGFGGPAWAARMVIGWLPEPDLVVNLTAPPEVIHRRKSELRLEDIHTELEAWERIPASRLMSLTTDRPAKVVARSILEMLNTL